MIKIYKFGKRSLKNLKGVHPKLVEFANELLKIAKNDFTVIWGVRTLKQQQTLFAQGRTKKGIKVTWRDGINRKSNHQVKADGLGYAIDIALWKGRKMTWENKIYDEFITEEVRKLMKKYSIKWGGDWKKKDRPHFEYVGGNEK